MTILSAIYNRVSREEQARDSDALKRMIFHCDRAAERLGLDPNKIPHFEDRQSGRDDDRPDFERLRRKLEARQFNMLIVYRIDRITRRLVTNAELAELFRDQKIQVHVVVNDRTFDLTRRADWEDFVNQGVRAEGETRELESRVRLGLEFRASQGKFLGAVPFGYQRVDGILVPDDRPFPGSPHGYDYWTTAIESAKILVQSKAVRQAAREVKQKLGWDIHPSSFRRWAVSSAVQGHSISIYAEFMNTHPAIVSLEQAELISLKDYNRSDLWGNHNKKYIHLFTGLCFCANCGSRLQAKPSSGHTYYRCEARLMIKPESACTGVKRPFGKSTIKEGAIENAVRLELIKNAETLINAGLRANNLSKNAPNPEIINLEKQIKQTYKMIGEYGDKDGYLGMQLRSLQSRISAIQNEAESIEIDDSARMQQIEYAKDWTLLDELDRWERKAFYKSAVKQVLVDWDRVISVDLADRVKPR